MADAPITGLALLRVDFPPHQISKLPKGTKAQNEALRADYKLGKRCLLCGGWHQPEVAHLDYVGHAAATDRLLDADPGWTWEPVAFGANGLPAFDATGGLWIRLTVCGVTRLGYGNAANKPNADPGSREKECIGDALRNALMRFGGALDLWHKGDLHLDDEEEKKPDAKPPAVPKQAGPSQDLSPKARAERIMVGVAAGDAAGAALSLSEMDQQTLEGIWQHIGVLEQDKLTAAWPKVAA